MPLPGDQHRDTAATTNPFASPQSRVTAFTAKEIATLQSRLVKQLGPEYISTRPGNGGGKVHYLAAEKVINLANEVFGFNGWSSSIQNVQIDFVDENSTTGKITLGLSTIVRVTIRDGTYHEDIGYGHIENCKGKAAAFEKAKKEAATDAMKRALRNFGNVLGNCLYDKEYLQKVTKVKFAPTRWDVENLHRHPDYAAVKRQTVDGTVETPQRVKAEGSGGAQRQTSVQSGASFGSMEFEDDFDGNPFDDADLTHPDEVRLEEYGNAGEASAKKVNVPSANDGPQQRQAMARVQSMPQIRPSNVQSPAAVQPVQPMQRPQGPIRPPNSTTQAPPVRGAPHPPQAMPNQQRPPDPIQAHTHSFETLKPADSTTSYNPNPQQQRQPNAAQPLPRHPNQENAADQDHSAPRMPPPGAPEGFVTGRSAEMLNQPPGVRPANSSLAFNPHADSPSIRRTQGVNPGKSAPVTRQAITNPNGGGVAHMAVAPSGGAPQQYQQAQAQSNSAQTSGTANGMNGTTAPIRTNYVNPSANMNRQIGMPPPPAGPATAAQGVQNRASYKPPTPMKRPPLSDVSNLQQQQFDGSGAGEVKKPRLDPEQAAPAAGATVVEDGNAGGVVREAT